jgi:hypothetical protein
VALTEELIPSLHNFIAALFCNPLKLAQCPRLEASIVGHLHLRQKPELGVSVVLLDMDVHRFARIAFIGEEVEAIAIPGITRRREEEKARRGRHPELGSGSIGETCAVLHRDGC